MTKPRGRVARCAAILALVAAAACTGSSPGDPEAAEPTPTPTATQPPVDGGTVHVRGAERPSSLTPLGAEGDAARRLLEPVLLGAYVQQPDSTFVPQLLSTEADVTTDPFTVSYWIHPDARWNDGTPVTSADFAFTARQNAAEPGYDLIRKTERLGPKRVRFTFRAPYAAYRSLFDPVLPAHVAPPASWGDRVPVASGPFEFDQWARGAAILKRNENYWATPAHLDEVILEFRRDDLAFLLADQTVAVGEVGLDAEIAQRVQALAGVVSKAVPGAAAEVLLIDASRGPLRDPRIRRAVALAVDRTALVDLLVADVHPDAKPLQSLVSLEGDPGYAPHFELYDGDLEAAAALLDEAGCPEVGGARQCDGAPLIVRYPAPTEADIEQIQWQLVAGDLAAIGVSAQPVFDGEVDLTFARWDWPWASQLLPRFACPPKARGCKETIPDLLTALDRAADPVVATEARSAAGQALARDPRVLPLYQQPLLTAWQEDVVGVQGNPGPPGLLWNAGEWFLLP